MSLSAGTRLGPYEIVTPLGAFNYPHIVTIHEVERFEGIDCIVMELVAGRKSAAGISLRGSGFRR